MKKGSIVTAKKDADFGGRATLLARTHGVSIPINGELYTVAQDPIKEKCCTCGRINCSGSITYLVFEETGEETGYDADEFIELQAPGEVNAEQIVQEAINKAI